MSAASYAIYRKSVQQLMQEDQRLPSLPAQTLRIREALSSETINHKRLGELISQDPSLVVRIMREVQSPIYLTQEKPGTLFDAMRLLGLENLERIAVLHGLKSLFLFRNPRLQKLFDAAWKRQSFKAAISRLLARELGYRPIDEAVVTSLLTEVGTLVILSALTDEIDTPDLTSYFKLCDEYSQSLGSIILRKWDIGEQYLDAIKHNGQWNYVSEVPAGQLALTDLVNLALYHSIALRNKNPQLPPLQSLPLFQHIPTTYRAQGSKGMLTLVTQNLQEILDDTKRMMR